MVSWYMWVCQYSNFCCFAVFHPCGGVRGHAHSGWMSALMVVVHVHAECRPPHLQHM
jgi:hypothetical protein